MLPSPLQPSALLWVRMSDERLQFVVMRDPRSQAVSTFFFEHVHHHKRTEQMIGAGLDNVGDFVLEVLPNLCQWMSIRYALFSGPMAQQSTMFWYEDAMSDAVTWHHNWLASVGLNLPESIVQKMAHAAEREEFDFETLGRNEHPGQEAKGAVEEHTSHQDWKENVPAEILEEIDDILRLWLPPVILARLGISP